MNLVIPRTPVHDFAFGYSPPSTFAATAFVLHSHEGLQHRPKPIVSETFTNVAAEWMEKNEREGRAVSTLEKMHWLLAMAKPMVGNLPISEIGPQDVLAVLRKIETRGHYETAQRMRSVFSRVFRYAVATGRANRDVVSDLRGALITPKVKHRAAITTQEEVGPLLRAIAGYKGQGITRIALQLAAHLFVRPGGSINAERHSPDHQDRYGLTSACDSAMGGGHEGWSFVRRGTASVSAGAYPPAVWTPRISRGRRNTLG